MTGQTPRSVPERPPTPRWLKVLVITGFAVLLVVIAVTLMTGVGHGPGSHGG